MKKIVSLIVLLCAFCSFFGGAEIAWGETARTTFLKSLDKMLALFSDKESRSYIVDKSEHMLIFKNTDPYMLHFNQLYGYFSEEHPIASRVTDDREDLEVTKDLLEKMYTSILDPLQLELTAAEIITKVLAYRELTRGQIIQIPVVMPSGDSELVIYEVDEVLNLWHGMPAFGLLPQTAKHHVPILLFRGTDLSFVSEKGWASVISDLEMHDPGLATFQRGQALIHAWLLRAKERVAKARVMGVSLGGILTSYTLLFEKDLINQDFPSIAMNPPGVSREILLEWSHLAKKPPLHVYITQGDAIPKYGRLIGDCYLFSEDTIPGPIAAHTQLVTLSRAYYLQTIDVRTENAHRRH